MLAPRFILAATALSASLFAAESAVDRAVLRLDLMAAKAPKALAMEFRVRAAEALHDRHPELAQKLVDQTLADLRGGKDWVVGYGVVQGLAALSPADALSVLPHLAPGYAQIVITALAASHRTDEAVTLYLDLLKRGQVRPAGASSLIGPLLKQNPAQAVKLFTDVLAALPDPPDPADAAWIVNTAPSLAPASKAVAAGALERVLKAATTPDYAAGANPVMIGAFTSGSKPVTTANTRDTLLLLSAVWLRAIAPDRLEKYSDALARWNGASGMQFKSIGYKANTPPAAPGELRAVETAINQRMGTIRGKATDAERAAVVLEIVRDIRSMPPGPAKLGHIRSLANLTTEGNLGKEALDAVAGTLAESMRDSFPSMIASKQGWPYGDAYIELAKLVRYEGAAAPFADPALDAAGALLELRERVQQENGFTLTSLDGKTYTLAGLKGRVVLLNFWATWCPPCRKEMPDMEKLYRRLEAKGLTVIGVSDEDRETVERFLAKTPYSFPIALDPGRKVNTAFMVEGIPKSFLFDREGRLAALAIDMRTEAQFLDMFKKAGLE